MHTPFVSEANISEANISEANISEANISEANISEANNNIYLYYIAMSMFDMYGYYEGNADYGSVEDPADNIFPDRRNIESISTNRQEFSDDFVYQYYHYPQQEPPPDPDNDFMSSMQIDDRNFQPEESDVQVSPYDNFQQEMEPSGMQTDWIKLDVDEKSYYINPKPLPFQYWAYYYNNLELFTRINGEYLPLGLWSKVQQNLKTFKGDLEGALLYGLYVKPPPIQGGRKRRPTKKNRRKTKSIKKGRKSRKGRKQRRKTKKYRR